MIKSKTRVELQISKGKSCINCGVEDDTIIPHHYIGINKFDFWNRSKVHDILTADICYKCHNNIHTGWHFMSKKRKSSLQISWILETVKRDYEDGNLILKNITFEDLNDLICSLKSFKFLFDNYLNGNLIYRK